MVCHRHPSLLSTVGGCGEDLGINSDFSSGRAAVEWGTNRCYHFLCFCFFSKLGNWGVFFISYRKLFPKKLNSNSDVFVISPSQNEPILPSFLHIQIGFASIRVKEVGLIYFARVIFLAPLEVWLWGWIFRSVGQSVITGWTSMAFCTYIHGPQRMKPNVFDPWSLFVFLVQCLIFLDGLNLVKIFMILRGWILSNLVISWLCI